MRAYRAYRVQGFGFRVKGVGYRGLGLIGFTGSTKGSGFRVKGLGFRASPDPPAPVLVISNEGLGFSKDSLEAVYKGS